MIGAADTGGLELMACVEDADGETKEKSPGAEEGEAAETKDAEEGCEDEEERDGGEKKEIVFKLGQERTEFSVDEIPKEATVVDCQFCEELKTLPEHWPPTVTKIDLRYCKSITKLPENWPSTVTTINLGGCENLTKLPENWPPTVTTINLSYCMGITKLPENWPPTVTTINLYGCKKLSALPLIPPAALKSINVEECDALPASVRNLGDFEVKSPADWHHVAAVCLAAHLQRSTTDLPVIEQFLESFLVDDYTPTADEQQPPQLGDDDERKGGGEDGTARNETAIVAVEEDGGGDGEKGGRFVTCSKFQDFVGGSLVAPVWPANREIEEARTRMLATREFSDERDQLKLVYEQKIQENDEAKARMLAAPEGSEERQSLELAYKQNMHITAEGEQLILNKIQINLPDSASRTDSSSGNARLHRLTRITYLANPAHDFLGALLSLPPWAQARLFQSEVSLTLFGRMSCLFVTQGLHVDSYVYVLVSVFFFSSIIPEHIYPLLPPSPFLRPPSSALLPLSLLTLSFLTPYRPSEPSSASKRTPCAVPSTELGSSSSCLRRSSCRRRTCCGKRW